MTRNRVPRALVGPAIAVLCLALAGPVGAGEDPEQPSQPAVDESAATKPERPGAEERAQKLTDRMKKDLDLTKEQIPRVAEVNLRIARQVDAIMGAPGGDRRQRVHEVRATQEERDKELRQILSEAQWQQYEKMKAEMKAKLRERVKEHRRRGGGSGDARTPS
jgi:hypothetical protein